MRSVLQHATKKNARLTAAAIGGSLVRLVNQRLASEPDVNSSIDAVRNATFELLAALARGTGAARARSAALRSLDDLELALSMEAAACETASEIRTDRMPEGRNSRLSRFRALIRRVVPDLSAGFAARHG